MEQILVPGAVRFIALSNETPVSSHRLRCDSKSSVMSRLVWQHIFFFSQARKKISPFATYV